MAFQQILRRGSSTSHLMPKIVILLDSYGFLMHLIPIVSLTHVDFAECTFAQRFISNPKQCQQSQTTGPLTPTEFNSARLTWIKTCQEQIFANEISNLKSQHDGKHSKKIPPLARQLRLFLDHDGFVRCGGRIYNALLSDAARFPHLLPQKHTVTKLLIYSLHKSLFHGGVKSTLTALRKQYWFPSGRQYSLDTAHSANVTMESHILPQNQCHCPRTV